MIKQKYFTGGNLFVALSIGFILWVIIAAVLDDRVKRSELPDDSIILVLGAYRFKVPVNYLYAMLLENEVAKMKYGIKERKYKKVKEVDYFSISVAYPDMKPMTIAEDKPGWGSEIMIYLSINKRKIPYRKSAATRIKKESTGTNPGIVPHGFGSKEVLKFEDYWFDNRASSGDQDAYIYKGDLIYMQCGREDTEHTPPSPSCTIYSSYKNLEMSASFSVKYKTEFIKINTLIIELFQSFEQQPKETADAN